jgi:Na+-transporting NADH:ubiquinone oxidoreductase subunit NqrC
MSEWIKWIVLPAAAMPVAGYAVQYLTVEQAQQQLFEAGTLFTAENIDLRPDQIKAIETASQIRVRDSRLKAWKASRLGQYAGWFIVDEVYGKHEFITYSLAIDTKGAVKGIEILDYRETYGGEVRNANWRKQFIGKTSASPLKLDDDIKNISGATLSSRHITDGVKRLLATYEVVLK